MLMLCQQSATLLKTRLPHRRFLVFLDFTKNSAIKKHKCINDLMLLLCHQSVTYQKWDFDTGVFLWILWTFSAWNFIKNEAPAQVFSCEFWEIAVYNFRKARNPSKAFSSEIWDIFTASTLITLHYRCFPQNFAKSSRTLFL